MPRKKREWTPGSYYHVVMRGNNRKNIYHNTKDVQELFRIFMYVYHIAPFKIIAYCIMTNHFHLLIRSDHTPLDRIMCRINKRYSDYYRKKYKVTGHIYEKRYFSNCARNPRAILDISSYIHRNPIDTTIPMVSEMQQYPHSSFQYYDNHLLTVPDFMDTKKVLTLLPIPYPQTFQGYCLYCRSSKQSILHDETPRAFV